MDIKMKFLSLTFLVSLFCLVKISAQEARTVKVIENKAMTEAATNTVVVINDGEVEVYKWVGEKMPSELETVASKYKLDDVFGDMSFEESSMAEMEVIEEEVVTNENGQEVVKKTKKVVKKEACSPECKKACEDKKSSSTKAVQSDIQSKKTSCSSSVEAKACCKDGAKSSTTKAVQSDVQVKKTSCSSAKTSCASKKESN